MSEEQEDPPVAGYFYYSFITPYSFPLFEELLEEYVMHQSFDEYQPNLPMDKDRRLRSEPFAPPPGDKCLICQEEFLSDQKTGQVSCRHYFHQSCIEELQVYYDRCPICRKTLESVEKN